jgi:hypothetical protein
LILGACRGAEAPLFHGAFAAGIFLPRGAFRTMFSQRPFSLLSIHYSALLGILFRDELSLCQLTGS